MYNDRLADITKAAYNSNDVEELLIARRESQQILDEISYRLNNILENFEGTLGEAIRLGLVKPAFSMPKRRR